MKLSGIVKKHLGRGKDLSFPTANLEIGRQDVGDGIYMGFTYWEGKKFPSVIFVGAAVTFGETERHAEVHVLDFEKDLYGQEIEVELLEKIRDNKRFDTKAELVVAMQEDERVAREYFKLSSRTPDAPPGQA